MHTTNAVNLGNNTSGGNNAKAGGGALYGCSAFKAKLDFVKYRVVTARSIGR